MSGYPPNPHPHSGAWADPQAWGPGAGGGAPPGGAPGAHGSGAFAPQPPSGGYPPQHGSGAFAPQPAHGSGVYAPQPQSGGYPPSPAHGHGHGGGHPAEHASGAYGPGPQPGGYPGQPGSGGYGQAPQQSGAYAPPHPGGGAYAQPHGSGAYQPSVAGGDPYASHNSYYGSQAYQSGASGQVGGSGRSRPVEPPKGPPFGAYELVKELGRGGMGVVYQAYQPALRRYCALKVLHGATDPERLVHEAQTCAKLGKHPNIVQVFDAGVINGTAYLTMEMVKGVPLDEKLQKDGVLTEAQVLDIGYKVAVALNHAHRQGLIHRDMKPANVILDENAEPHVLDFGLAKDLVEGDAQFAGCMVGTPAYMPPEQFRAKDGKVDARADIYSLGATLYNLLCGKVPFDGHIQQIMFQLMTSPPPRLRSMVTISRDLEAVIEKAMEKDPLDRYQSALEMADDLSRVKAGEPPRARRMGPIGRALRRAQRHPVVTTLALIIVLFGAASGAYLQHRQTESNRLWLGLSQNIAHLAANEARSLLAPAIPLLKEMRTFGEQGLSQIGDRTVYGRELAMRFDARRLDWLDMYYPDGSYVGATRRDGQLIINESWIIDKEAEVGREIEYEVLTGEGWKLQKLHEAPRYFDGREEDCFSVVAEQGLDGPVWVGPYQWEAEAIMESRLEWGVSCSAAVRGPDRDLRAVVVANFYLVSLAKFLKAETEHKRPGSTAYLFTRDGTCFARSDVALPGEESGDAGAEGTEAGSDRSAGEGASVDERMAQSADEATPPVLASAMKAIPGGVTSLELEQQTALEFEHDGELYTAAIEVFPLPGGLEWGVAIILPVKVLRGDIQQANRLLVLAAIGAGSLVLLLALFALLRRWLRVRNTVRTIGARAAQAQAAAEPAAVV